VSDRAAAAEHLRVSDADAISDPVPVVALKKYEYILYLGRSCIFILIKVYFADINICSSL